MWRVGPDIKITHDTAPPVSPWDFKEAGYEIGVYQSYDSTIALSRYVGPGSWNDADQLMLGDNGLSTSEERSQMGLWSIMGAPLFISADVRKMVNPQTAHLKDSLAILSNKRVIAVNQDPLGAGGYRVLRDNPATNAGFDVVVKPLKDGSLAALVLNKNASEQTYTLKLATLGLAPAANGAYTVHHLWTGASQSSVKAVTMRIAPHDNMMLRIVGGGALTPTGQIQTVQPSFDVAAKCLSVEGSAKPGASIIIDNCSNSAKQQWQRQANGRIRLLDSNLCLSANNGPVNSSHSQWAKLDACNPNDRKQAFTYTMTGNLKNSQGCLGVFRGTVAIAGSRVNMYRCAAETAPQVNQIWSAPHGAKL